MSFQESLELHSKYVAIVPLVMYTSSFFTSMMMKYVNNKAGRKITFLMGIIIGKGLGLATVFFFYELF